MSLQLHPDKNTLCSERAKDAFAEVVAAYEILNSPDKRSKFDDYGGDDDGLNGFESEWEYEKYKTGTNERDFYTGHPLITTLTQKSWELKSKNTELVWLVEFYAPWCTACQVRNTI